MSTKAKWIWNKNDFELYHCMLLSCRREEYGMDYPPVWYITKPELCATFIKSFTAPKDTTVKAHTYCKGIFWLNGEPHPVNEEFFVKAGKHDAKITLYSIDAFPSLFIDSEYLKTDESWQACANNSNFTPAMCEPTFFNSTDDPRVFPFCYEPISPVKSESVNGGVLYDFGKEQFGPITLGKILENDSVLLCYGESREEALDPKEAIIREYVTAKTEKRRPCRAFRYIFVKSEKNNSVDIGAEYEYLPVKDIGSFTCDSPQVKAIWDICAHTFHLNSREFYLDGIKRDRWIWSGDTYQSFMINRYLYWDEAIVRRTITALLGKPPYKNHINTINDYSAFLIISVWEHYYATGDLGFVKNVWGNISQLYEFITSRLDENGYVVARNGDWIFIDWGDVDKSGTLCAEQILLWETYNSMARLAEALGSKDTYSDKANSLKANILKDFWCAEKKAFIDCYNTGNAHISRQSNILAILYDFVDSDTACIIAKSVLYNENITPITTPYFKLYELMALCKLGDISSTLEYIGSYWGGMLDLGATSVWEQFNPLDKGAEHYAMYKNMPYGKSLCHAWGSGPIYLLGRYCCGVYPTDVGYKTFNVEPNFADYKNVKATVPVRNGQVSIEYKDGFLKVTATVSGGTLLWNNQKYVLEENKTIALQ